MQFNNQSLSIIQNLLNIQLVSKIEKTVSEIERILVMFRKRKNLPTTEAQREIVKASLRLVSLPPGSKARLLKLFKTAIQAMRWKEVCIPWGVHANNSAIS